jgi:hypothetical protein
MEFGFGWTLLMSVLKSIETTSTTILCLVVEFPVMFTILDDEA